MISYFSIVIIRESCCKNWNRSG